MGAVDYIVRPINNQELVLRVKNALDHFKQFRSLQRSLENSEDMANTGRILAASNHEIRNIVGLINICTEQALIGAERGESMSPGTTGFQSLSSLSKMTKMLTDIAKDLNSHIHTERVRTNICSVRDIIDNMLSLTEQKLRGIQIARPIVSDQYYVRADATRVLQILLNFSLNALDAIEEKGARSKGRLEIKVTESSHDILQIRVSDNGIGLVTAAKKIEFQPFETTKAVKGGKGLGLWLCSRLANAMDGSIFLESKGPGFGTTAVLELKRATPNRDTDLNLTEYFID
jgi:C4-dicarboxylate-specific signal transduction histidine kinase